VIINFALVDCTVAFHRCPLGCPIFPKTVRRCMSYFTLERVGRPIFRCFPSQPAECVADPVKARIFNAWTHNGDSRFPSQESGGANLMHWPRRQV
jgi:hypothetical protein